MFFDSTVVSWFLDSDLRGVLCSVSDELWTASLVEHHTVRGHFTLELARTISRVEGAGLVPWVGGPSDASFGFYLREALQSQTHTEKILYNKSL